MSSPSDAVSSKTIKNASSKRLSISYALFVLTVVSVTAALLVTDSAKRLDWLIYDTWSKSVSSERDPNTVIVAIDEKSLNAIGRWPWRRGVHAQIVDALSNYQVSGIAFDILFPEADPNFPEDDKVFAQAINRNRNVILPIYMHPLSFGRSLTEIMPISPLVDAAHGLAHVHVQMDTDGIARGLFLNSGMGDANWPALSLAMAYHTNPMIKHIREELQEEIAPFINANTQYRLIPFVGPAGSFPTYSYIDILLGQVDKELLRNKMVLIGATAAGLGDVIPTPVSGLSSPMSGVELHANAHSALISNVEIYPLTFVLICMLSAFIVLIPILIFPRLAPSWVMPFTIVYLGLTLGFSFALLKWNQIWFPPAAALIGILVSYPLWSWQRMRHLNAFLNESLERLGQDQALKLSSMSEMTAEQLCYALVEILKPEAYSLIEDGELILGDPLDAPEKDEEAIRSGIWQHDRRHSQITAERDEKSYQFIFQWPEQHTSLFSRRFLNRLKMNQLKQDSQTRSYEKVASRIEQVQTAISALKDMRSFITNGFEEMPDAILVTDPVGTVVYCNSRAATWLEKEVQELVGKRILNLFDPSLKVKDSLEQMILRVLLTGGQETIETELGQRDVLIHCVPSLKDDRGDAGLIVSFSDITTIKQQQREKNQLIDFLSHDVRSPLVSLLAILEGLRSGRIAWSEEMIGKLSSQANKSLNLSEQFLQITRAEQTSSESFYDFDIITALESAADELAPQASKKGIKIEFEPDDAIWVKGNAELMERLFTNLLSNAVKYSPEDTRIKIDIRHYQDAVSIAITDQGEGIAPEELPHIFNRFKRQRSSELKGNKGAGLGLNFVQVVAEKHRGRIEVDSQLGKGSTFRLTLPALQLQDSA